MSPLGKRLTETTKTRQAYSATQPRPSSSTVAAEPSAFQTLSTSTNPRSVPPIDQLNVANSIPRSTELGGVSPHKTGSESSVGKSPTRFEDGSRDHYSTAGKNYTLSSTGSGYPVSNDPGSHSGKIASKSDDDHLPASHLSVEQLAFFRLDYFKPDAWRQFLRDHPRVVALGPADFVKEVSLQTSRNPRFGSVKRCVQRATVLKFCKNKSSPQEIDKWFISLRDNQKTKQEFISQADAIYQQLAQHPASRGLDSDFEKPYGWGIVRVPS